MNKRWITQAINAAERGDVDACQAALAAHFTEPEIFFLLKVAALRYGMTTEEMAQELEDYLERYMARQTRH